MNITMILAMGVVFILGLPLAALLVTVGIGGAITALTTFVTKYLTHTDHGGFATPHHA